ncbi:MAG: M48 family metalloprotease, partial [Litorimonas sp.]
RAVVPGSPADEADIRPGEEIVSGWPIRADAPLVLDAGQGSAPLRIDADDACVAPAFVINSDALNAGTDGREIELSSALVESVRGDAALAFVIAHEMAHVLRGHSPEGPRWEVELQADRDALTLMRNAGYDIAETVAGWEAGVEIHRESQSFSRTHPPLDIRLFNLERELARLEALEPGFLELSD